MSDKKEPPASEPTFQDRASLNNAFSDAGRAGLFGLVVSAVQNALGTHKAGAMGVFTRSGSTIALFTGAGAAYGFFNSFVANNRRKDDAINSASGACAAGLVVGASARSVPLMFGSCAGLAALTGTFDAAGRSLQGSYPRASPFIGQSTIDPTSHSDETGGPGEPGWRDERERRRNSFFKVRKPPSEEE